MNIKTKNLTILSALKSQNVISKKHLFQTVK